MKKKEKPTIRISANGQTVDLSSKKARRDWRLLLKMAGIREMRVYVPELGVIKAREWCLE